MSSSMDIDKIGLQLWHKIALTLRLIWVQYCCVVVPPLLSATLVKSSYDKVALYSSSISIDLSWGKYKCKVSDLKWHNRNLFFRISWDKLKFLEGDEQWGN